MHSTTPLLGLLLLSALVAFSYQAEAQRMKCYKCRADSEEECLEEQEIKECRARGRWQCAAFTTQIGKTLPVYRKGCLGQRLCKKAEGEVCMKQKSGTIMCYTCCDGELCNSGKIKVPPAEPKCYSCMSSNKTECDNAATEITCADGKNHCAKTVLAGNGPTWYGKDCVSKEECPENGKRCEDMGSGMTFCMDCCEGDMCNDGEVQDLPRPEPRGISTQCYSCMSYDKSDCNKADAKTCPEGKDRCAKSYLTTEGVGTFYGKDCVSQEECTDMKGKKCEAMGAGMTYCLECCTGDKCNSGEMKSSFISRPLPPEIKEPGNEVALTPAFSHAAPTKKRTLSKLLTFKDE